MSREEFGVEIVRAAGKMDIKLSESQINNLYKYMEILIQWNQKINLTTIVEPKEIILKHYIDSFTVAKYLKENDKLIDVGTGAGFPGIPLKILRNDIEVVLLDSLNKRIKFLDEVIETLGLDNIETIHGRIEEIGQLNEHRESYDVVVSRAVAKLGVLAEYMIPFAKIDGQIICMKGVNVDEELKECSKAVRVLGGTIAHKDEINLIDTDNKRNIVVIKKEKYTPKQYPRKPGTPSKEPII